MRAAALLAALALLLPAAHAEEARPWTTSPSTTSPTAIRNGRERPPTKVVDAQGKAVAGFIVPVVLRAHTANSWITWRENTPFKPSSRQQLAARIASGADDNRRQASA